jgi:hypothetical protein
VTAGRDDVPAPVRDNVAADDVVPVKESRGAPLEQVAEGSVTEGDGGR